MTPEQELAELKQLIKQQDELMIKITEYGDGADMYEKLKRALRRLYMENLLNLENSRNDKYLNAWLLTGKVTKTINREILASRLIESELFYVWDIILCKMMRAITSPTYDDHWADTVVYSKIVIERFNFPVIINEYPNFHFERIKQNVLSTIAIGTDNPRGLMVLVDSGLYPQWLKIMESLILLWWQPFMVKEWENIKNIGGQVHEQVRS